MKRFGITIVCLAMLAGCAAQQSLEKNTALAAATREIGEAYMRQGDYTSALRELLKARDLDPDDPFVHDDLGICYMAKERMADAVVHFKKAIALKPGYAPARNNLGSAYLAMERWDDAIVVFKEITHDVLYATPHFPLSNLGIAYFRKGDYAKSLDYYKEALKVQPDFVNALYGIGRTYLAMNQGGLAVRHLERAAQQSPKVPEIHFDLAEAYLLAGRLDQARYSYETVIDLTPSDSPLAAKARQRLGNLSN
jgi:type IV pilus assembly protein PilF